jgi:hypothetical protein
MPRIESREPTLDPESWEEFRALARTVMDDTVDELRRLPARHGWRPMSEKDKAPSSPGRCAPCPSGSR